MTLQEFYDAIGGDYKGVMSRLHYRRFMMQSGVITRALCPG